MPLSAGKYLGLRRLADARGRFKMVAIDQRTPLFGPIAAKRGTADAPYEDVVAVKERLAGRLSPKASAMLLDPIYAFPRVLPVMDVRPGLMLSLEHSRVEDVPPGHKNPGQVGEGIALTVEMEGDGVRSDGLAIDGDLYRVKG